MEIFRKGYIVAVLLAVFTVVEYLFADPNLTTSNETVRIIGLTISALIKAVLIVWYFMHVYRVWRTEESH